MSHGVVAHIFLPSDWPWNCLGKASISLVSNMWWRHSSGLKMGPFPRKNGLPDVCGGKRSIYFWTCLGGTNDGTRIPNKKLRLVWAVIYVWNLTTALVCLFLGKSKLHESNHGNPSHHHVFFDVRGNAKEVLTCFSWQVTRKGHTLILSNTNCKTNIFTNSMPSWKVGQIARPCTSLIIVCG